MPPFAVLALHIVDTEMVEASLDHNGQDQRDEGSWRVVVLVITHLAVQTCTEQSMGGRNGCLACHMSLDERTSLEPSEAMVGEWWSTAKPCEV
jgi:hypothetical protein